MKFAVIASYKADTPSNLLHSQVLNSLKIHHIRSHQLQAVHQGGGGYDRIRQFKTMDFAHMDGLRDHRFIDTQFRQLGNQPARLRVIRGKIACSMGLLRAGNYFSQFFQIQASLLRV